MEQGRDYRRSESHASPPWPDQHLYPHSHHGTPAQEYAQHNWSYPHLPDIMSYQRHLNDAQYQPVYDQRLDPTMPTWPSQLTGDHPTVYRTSSMIPTQPGVAQIDHFAHQAIPSASANPNSTNPRRTLTDDDRREMCLFAEENPTLKQVDIGTRFKVDRSTVSKVLRHREKYLTRRAPSRPPLKREKSRRTEVENAMANWAAKQRKRRVTITEDAIRKQAKRFAEASGGEISNPATSLDWVLHFKSTHSPRPASKTPGPSDGSEVVSNPDSRESKSPTGAPSPAVAGGLHVMRSNDDIASGVSDTTTDPRSPSQPPSMSISSALAQEPPNLSEDLFPDAAPYFSHLPGAPPSTFTRRSVRPLAPASRVPSDRQRRSTFPRREISPYMTTSPREDQMGKHAVDTDNTLLDSPMDEYNSLLNGPEEHFYTDFPPTTTNANPASAIDESATISPADVMNAPPPPLLLPGGHRRTASVPTPTQDEARLGLETAMRYLQKQPQGVLDTNEAFVMARVQEKLNNQDSPASNR